MSSRLATLALAAVFALVVAALAAADRALRDTEHAAAALDAVESAALVESFLAVHAAALGALHALYVTPGGPVDTARFHALVETLGEHVTGFRRMWVTDSAGRLVHDLALDAGRAYEASSPPAWEAAPTRDGGSAGTIFTARTLAMGELAERARATRRMQVSRPGRLPTGEPGFAILEPVFIGRHFVGLAGGVVTARALLARLPSERRLNDAWLAVLAGPDTVAATAVPRRVTNAAAVHAPVRAPGRHAWAVVVAREPGGWPRRLALWGPGLALFLALALGLLHERRQAERLVERTAELERLSAELFEASRAKSEFLANVSHELRTPLTAIVGFVDLLRDGIYGELTPRQAAPVERIDASANHLRELVDQVLDLAKIAAGRVEVHREPLDLQAFAHDVAGEVEPLATAKGLQLKLAVGASLPQVRTDGAHLRQILVNLLTNAVKYSNEGAVLVRARLVGPPALVPRVASGRRRGDDGAALRRQAPDPDALWVALQVVDRGVGIARGDQERIFDEFEQVGAGPRSESMKRGTGLGLSISRRLARLLGGDVTVQSELGQGSTFTIWLPVSLADVSGGGRRALRARRAPG